MAAKAASASITAWEARWQSVKPKAAYNHGFGLEEDWRTADGAWGYPLSDKEIDVDVPLGVSLGTDPATRVRSGRVFSKAGLVVWDNQKRAILIGWPD